MDMLIQTIEVAVPKPRLIPGNWVSETGALRRKIKQQTKMKITRTTRVKELTMQQMKKVSGGW